MFSAGGLFQEAGSKCTSADERKKILHISPALHAALQAIE